MSSDLNVRRRRAVYRATHRGTKEMDWLLGRYVEAHVEQLDEPALERMERLLALPDPDLHRWIIDPATLQASDIAGDIAAIRAFHKLPAEAV
ncbi:MAG: succinate dehydrogenase assembly factor 2 [Hyphomicrobiaceae bacterium]|nr:succinate dehydrogenase assembly factor 2 [Hyphomicrobiaceae bacterium]